MRGSANIPVVSIVLRRDDKVLFVLRQNTDWMNGYYGLPGGHVEPGENFMSAARREVEEEIGVKLDPAQLKHLLTFQQFDERADIRVGIYFEAANWQGEPFNAEPDKHTEIAWLDPFEKGNKIIPTTRYKLEQIRAGVKYVELGWD
jgi:8-oxo-dGTP diphosphatase